MTFRDVIFKNFTKNLKKYLSYYFSGTFCVAMFFIYSTLMFMDSVKNADSEYPLFLLFFVCCFAISIFSIIFINYAHHMFIRNKKKELGIYMVVGMDENATRKMLAIETTTIAAASIISGTVVGALFSRYFQIIVQKLLNVEQPDFKIGIENFGVTALVFVLLYAVCFFITDRQMKKEDIFSIMKESRKKEGKPFTKKDPFLLIVGVCLMIFSVIFILSVATDDHINSSMWVMLTFLGSGYIGLFLVLNFGIKTFVYWKQKRINYYQSMITVSGMNQKFQQNSKIIIILAMMASMIVLLVGAPIALLSISGDIAEEGNSDLMYVTFADYQKDRVNQIMEQKEVESHKCEQISYIPIAATGEMKPILSVSDYNRQMGANLKVEPGQLYHMITTWEPGNHGYEAGDAYTIDFGSQQLSYTVCDSVKGDWDYSSMFDTESILILSDADYEKLGTVLPKTEVNLINFKENWRKTGVVIDAVKVELKQQIDDKCFVSSIQDIYQNLKSGYSVFLFSSCFMCFMFFVSTGCVLYFKQYNEIDEEKEQYLQLYKIGISDKIVKRSISAKLAVVYFLPVLGIIMGVMISYYMASMFGGSSIISLFIKKSLIGVLCYVGSQTVFYLFLRGKYLRDVLKTTVN